MIKLANKPWLKKQTADKVIDVMGAKITLQSMNYGDARKAVSSAVSINPATKQVSIDQGLAGALRSLAMIKEWDLTDENDKPLPITLEVLDSLDEEFASELIAKVNAQDDNAPSEDEKK